MRLATVFILVTAFLLSVACVVEASQLVSHVYLALRAKEEAPPLVQEILDEHLSWYLAGSTGPDIAMIAGYLSGNEVGFYAHTVRSGELIHNLLKRATTVTKKEAATLLGTSEEDIQEKVDNRSLQGISMREKDCDRYSRVELGIPLASEELAFVLGWITHYVTDALVHPLVNAYGGLYPEGKERHTRLESVEVTHVLERAIKEGMDPSLFVVQKDSVPINLLYEGFLDTYGLEIVSPNRKWYAIRPSFLKSLETAAWSMELFSRFCVRVFEGEPIASSAILDIVMGTPPTREEYARLMNPMVIESVNKARTNDEIQVTYTLYDLGLYKAVCKEWDSLFAQIVKECGVYFHQYAEVWRFNLEPLHHPAWKQANPLPNKNLNTGLLEGTPPPYSFWPNEPTITKMRAFLQVEDQWGNEVQALDLWIDIPKREPKRRLFGLLPEAFSWIEPRVGTFSVPVPFFEGERPYTYGILLQLAEEDPSSPFYGQSYGVEVRAEGRLY